MWRLSAPLTTTFVWWLQIGCWGTRYTLVLLGFLGFANVYAMRVNLSVAIVAMVNHTAIPHINQTDVDICPEPTDTPDSAVKVIRKMRWPIAFSPYWCSSERTSGRGREILIKDALYRPPPLGPCSGWWIGAQPAVVLCTDQTFLATSSSPLEIRPLSRSP